MNNVPKITLDNNCVINLLDGNVSTPTSREALQELIRLGLSNKIEMRNAIASNIIIVETKPVMWPPAAERVILKVK